MIAPALPQRWASASSRAARPRTTVLGWLGDREACSCWTTASTCSKASCVLLERLLAACPRLTVLATSRARLLVPFERVFPVPGLSSRRPTAAGRRGGAVPRAGRRRREAAGAGRPAPGRADVPRPGRHGPGHRAGRRPAARRWAWTAWRPGWPTGCGLLTGGRAARRPAPFAALRAGLELCAADRGRAGDPAPRLRLRHRLHRRRRPRRCWPAGRPPGPRRPPDPAAGLAGLAEHSLLAAVAGPDGTQHFAPFPLLPQCCPRPNRAEMAGRSRTASPQVRTLFRPRTPNGIRTRATAVKGRRPRPLDDGGRCAWRGQHTASGRHVPTP